VEPLDVREMMESDLVGERRALIDLSRRAAGGGSTPELARDGPDAWLEWHWDEVTRLVAQHEVRVFAAYEPEGLVGTVQLRPIRAAGWGGWEPWKRLRMSTVMVDPAARSGVEAALLAFALSRSLVDFVVIETIPGGRVQVAAEGLGFTAAAVIADLLIGPDGSPSDGALLTRSHAKPPVIRQDLLAQVEAVPPSTDGRLLYRPCQVTLRDGRMLDRVYVQEAWVWKGSWGVWPEDDRGKASVSIDDVTAIADSPSRLPPALATRLLEAGETGMGYTKFTLVLRDGRRINTVTGNAVDFPGLPTGMVGADVIDVVPGEHVGTSETSMADQPYWWCLYTLPPDDLTR
jgi:hypothetical protein